MIPIASMMMSSIVMAFEKRLRQHPASAVAAEPALNGMAPGRRMEALVKAHRYGLDCPGNRIKVRDAANGKDIKFL